MLAENDHRRYVTGPDVGPIIIVLLQVLKDSVWGLDVGHFFYGTE